MNFNFVQKTGTGIEKLIPHASPEAIDLIKKLLTYNPEERYSARQALKHPYFREYHDKIPKDGKGGDSTIENGTTPQDDYQDDDKLTDTVLVEEPEKVETKRLLEDHTVVATKEKQEKQQPPQGDSVSHSLTDLHSQLFNSKDSKTHFPKIGKQEVKDSDAYFPPIAKPSKSVTNSMTLANTQKSMNTSQKAPTLAKSGRLNKMDAL
jgi:serine/threonine protein kinase